MMDKENGKFRGHVQGILVAALCVTVLVGAVLFAGCNGSEANQGNGNAAEKQEYSVQLYYVNESYMTDGEEALGHFKPPVKENLSASPEAVYMETLKALVNVPEGKEGEGFATMLKNNIKVAGAVLDENESTVTVDFQSQGLSGGSTEETLLVEQIVWTLTDSFDEVTRVQFTVDGAPAETLMGHLDVSVPYGLMEVDDGNGGKVETVMPIYD